MAEHEREISRRAAHHESRLVAAKQELLTLLKSRPLVREALQVRTSDGDEGLLKALSLAPNKFECLRNGGLSLSEALKATDLLDAAMAAPAEAQARQVVAKRSILRVWLSSLCFLELVICGLMLWTLETAAGGWEVGTCSLTMFTNVTCREQTSTRCAVDVEVRGIQEGQLRFFTMQNWHLPVAYKTEMGGNSFASYLGERLRCCNNDAGQVGSCCSLMESRTEIFCDNLQLVGMKAWDGTDCPANGWDCLYLLDEFDAARAKDVKTYTPPSIISFIVPAGVVAAMMVLTLVCSALLVCCVNVGGLIPARFLPKGVGEEDAEDPLEDIERDGSSKARAAAASTHSDQEQRSPGSKASRRSQAQRVVKAEMPIEVTEEIGELSPSVMSPSLTGSFSYRENSKMSVQTSSLQSVEEVVINPALASVPQAVLALPGVVQELETVAEHTRGVVARRQALEEEVRKYLTWDALEKPLDTVNEKDIHPDFKVGNLSRIAMIAEQARAQEAGLSPLIEPLPPGLPPSLPGSRPGTATRNRPGTGGSRPASATRPGTAIRSGTSGSRPSSATRAGTASRAGTGGRPQSVQAWGRPDSAKRGKDAFESTCQD